MRKCEVSLQWPISLLTNCHHSVTLSIRTASWLLLRRHLPDVHVDVVDLRLSAGCVYTLSITHNVVNLLSCQWLRLSVIWQSCLQMTDDSPLSYLFRDLQSSACGYKKVPSSVRLHHLFHLCEHSIGSHYLW